jgi:hypothetical protein
MYRNWRDTLTSNTENVQVFQKKVGIKEKQSGKRARKKNGSPKSNHVKVALNVIGPILHLKGRDWPKGWKKKSFAYAHFCNFYFA